MRSSAGLLTALVVTTAVIGCAAPHPRTVDSADSTSFAEESCCKPVADAKAEATVQARAVHYAIPPELELIDQTGRSLSLAEAIEGETPLALNFVFTTCTTICPVMSATFARLHEQLGPDGEDLRLLSISLDPEFDTPSVLREYARRFGADERWRFLTGDAGQLAGLYQQYEALTGTNKMTHLPFVLFRFPGEEQWFRVDGLGGTRELAAVYRSLRDQRK